MPNPSDRSYLLNTQYRDASNLDARIRLHRRFSTNAYGWFRWLFDQFELPSECRILELGSGPGYFWLENAHRIPEGWRVTLTDLSAGMARQARQNLGADRRMSYAIADAQDIPFASGRFDAVIANFMLYHVPDRARAFSEVRRVLMPNARFYAATVGQAHMGELWDLVQKFDPGLDPWGKAWTMTFALENGWAQIEPCFSAVTLRRYADALVVTEVAPLVDYVLSSIRLGMERRAEFVERPAEIAKFLEKELQARGGTIRITKDSGLFIAIRK